MHRYIFVILILLPAIVQARSVFEFTLDAGYSATQYTLSEGRLTGGMGYGADLGYAWFFHENVGLGLGAGFRHYAGGALINGTLTYPNVVDTDTEPYTHTTTYQNWREQHNLYYVEFPLSLQFFIPLKGINLWMALGANYSLALAGRTTASGDLTHRGYYPKWDLTLDIPQHGFYQTSDFRPSTSTKPLNTVAVFARFDIGIPIARNLDLILGVNAHYAVLSAYTMDGTTPLGFRNDNSEWSSAHYFMSDYSSLLNTSILSEKANPLNLDLEIGIKYSFGAETSNKCRTCKHLDDQWHPLRYRHHCILCE